MEEIIDRYSGQVTPQGHELKVDERNGDEVIVWYLSWIGADEYHHMGIARIRRDDSGFQIGWLRGDEQTPHQTEHVDALDQLFDRLDAVIAER